MIWSDRTQNCLGCTPLISAFMAAWLPEDIHLCQGSGPSYKVFQQVSLADCLAWGDRKTEKEEAESGPICLSPLWSVTGEMGRGRCFLPAFLTLAAGLTGAGGYPCFGVAVNEYAWTQCLESCVRRDRTGLWRGPMMAPSCWWHMPSGRLSPLLDCTRCVVHT